MADRPTLLSLPRELRDMIYEYACEDIEAQISPQALQSTNPVDAVILRKIALDSRRWGRLYEDGIHQVGDDIVRYRSTNSGMLSVCRQMRDEALKVYYSKSVFIAPGPDACIQWYTGLPAWKRRLVTKLRCQVCEDATVMSRRPTRHLRVVMAGRAKSFLKVIQEKIEKRTGEKMRPGVLEVNSWAPGYQVFWCSTPEAVAESIKDLSC